MCFNDTNMERSSRHETVAHSSVWLLFRCCVTISPTQAGWFCRIVIRFVSGQGVWREATRSIMSGLSNSRSTEGQFGPVMCRIILCSVRRSNRCYWHSDHQATVAPERYKAGAHLRITTVSTLVAKGILNFLSQYKYCASGISPFFGGFPKPSKSDY
jgi:hypothetical protein